MLNVKKIYYKCFRCECLDWENANYLLYILAFIYYIFETRNVFVMSPLFNIIISAFLSNCMCIP